jgi:hypothetical protein
MLNQCKDGAVSIFIQHSAFIFQHFAHSGFRFSPRRTDNNDGFPGDIPMHTHLAGDIQIEAELIERFVRSYRKRFATAIEELNRRSASAGSLTPEFQCLRLCVETMDMVLVNQERLATSLRRLTAGPTMRKAA